MNEEKMELLLQVGGWNLLCISPFEIEHQDGSFASGRAAEIILDDLERETKIMKFPELALGARFRYLKQPNGRIWIKINEDGCGLIAEYDVKYIVDKNWTGQQICSFCDTEDQMNELELILEE